MVPTQRSDGFSALAHKEYTLKSITEATVRVFFKWYLLSLKIKAQIDKDVKRGIEMTRVRNRIARTELG